MQNQSARIRHSKKIRKLTKQRFWLSLPVLLILGYITAEFAALGVSAYFNNSISAQLNEASRIYASHAALYGTGDTEDAAQVRDLLEKEGMQYVITDADGGVLYQNGENTLGTVRGSFVPTYSGLLLMEINTARHQETCLICDDTRDSILRQLSKGEVSVRTSEFVSRVRKAMYSPSKYNDTQTAEYEEKTDLEIEKEIKGLIDEFQEKLDSDASAPVWVGIRQQESGQTIFFQTRISFEAERILLFYVIYLFAILFVALIFLIALRYIIHGIAQNIRVKKLFFTDMTTRGHNRLWFLSRGDQLLSRRSTAKNTYALTDLLFVKYSTFCVCHSLKEGEEILKRIYDILKSHLEKKEYCARISEDSFGLLLKAENKKEAETRISEIVKALHSADTGHSFAFQAGVKMIGPAEENGNRVNRRRFLDMEKEYTDACMARTKLADSDESATVFYDSQLVEEQKWIDTVGETQQHALDNEEFVVYYQPKYDPQTHVLRGAEALIRWQSDAFGFVPPGKFIPIFEKNGFITEIDHYMIQHVARDQRRWLDAGYHCVPVSVNVSRAHFIESDLAEQICDLVDAAGTPHELIEIELTESAFFDDKKAMIATINKLKSYGFSVSMDDFGSGYSSLNSLKDMPLDILKLDAEFFRGEKADGERGEIVVAEAIRLAKSLHMRTVAEGVEEKEQVDFLASQGCDMIQGYYYAKPMPGQDYEERMKSGRMAPEEREEVRS